MGNIEEWTVRQKLKEHRNSGQSGSQLKNQRNIGFVTVSNPTIDLIVMERIKERISKTRFDPKLSEMNYLRSLY